MLDSVDLKVRLSKATELVDRHLQVCLLNNIQVVVPIRELQLDWHIETRVFLDITDCLLSLYINMH